MTSADTSRENLPVLSALEKRLLNEFQRNFPLNERPYQAIAETLGCDEETVIATLEDLCERGFIARIGATVRVHQAGWSTLAALAVPEERLPEVAALVTGFAEVNHNYEREHRFNLWFVVTGRDKKQVDGVLTRIKDRTGLVLLNLPMEEAYCLDLGFPLSWN
jgi:DNA-binding Lrp family transcriptional regulator